MSRRRLLSRRNLLIGGGALGLLVGVGVYRKAYPAPILAGSVDAKGANLHDFVHVATDGVVTVRCGFAEMGQGVFTGVGTLVAEELDCALDKLRVETGPASDVFRNVMVGMEVIDPQGGFAADPAKSGAKGAVLDVVARVAGQQITGGSSAITDRFVRAREAGAIAREMLIVAAARQWNVAPTALKAEGGFVIHAETNRRIGFGELAKAAAGMEPPKSIELKPRAQWKLIGKETVRRVDIPAKVDGSAVYGIDVRLPGMVYAAAMHCPVFGGSLKSFDKASIAGLKGVIGVEQIPGGVAVVADSTWRALNALGKLKVVWDEGPASKLSSADIDRQLKDALGGKLGKALEKGDFAAAYAASARKITADYTLPYLAHATMEPMNCTAVVGPDGVDVYGPMQAHTISVEAAAKAAGVSESKVRLHTTYLGGGFGRRLEVDFVAQAVTLAKAIGKPVKLQWSREEDMQHDFYRPAAAIRLEAGLAGDGMPAALRLAIASQSILERVFPPATWIDADPLMIQGAARWQYAIPNMRTDYAVVRNAVPVASWRSVGHSLSAYAKECFIDEMAQAAGVDPLAYRLKLAAQEPRLVRLLEAVRERSGWGAPLAKGEGRGVALHTSFNSAVAQVVEIAMAEGGRLTLKRVVAAVDCGTIVNPDVVRAQIEGGIIFGLTAALTGKITLAGGRVEQSNFTDYDVLKLAQSPKIEVILIPSQEYPGGVGEPGVPPAAPALANAIFAAIGKRIRALPLSDHGIAV